MERGPKIGTLRFGIANAPFCGLYIDNMPTQRKQIFYMSRKQGISNEEISQRLKISKHTVETHISIALATLRKITSALMLF